MHSLQHEIQIIPSTRSDDDVAARQISDIINSRTNIRPSSVKVSQSGRVVMARVTMPGGQIQDFQVGTTPPAM